MPEVPIGFARTVLFLGYRKGGFELAGTAFYVNSPSKWDADAFPPEAIPPDYANDQERFGWLVTARHVVEGIQRESDDGRVLLWVNSTDGERIDPFPEVAAEDWVQMPDEEATGYLVDCAIVPFAPPSDFDLVPIPVESIATRARIDHASIGPGHDVVYPSLYYGYHGTKRNVPLMRVGTIAAMADHDEPVYIAARSREAFAYIVEARSYRGVSGSPVFAALPPARTWKEEGTRGVFLRLQTSAEFYLLGVMITHFSLADEERELVNLGLGVVLDGSYIIRAIQESMQTDGA